MNPQDLQDLYRLLLDGAVYRYGQGDTNAVLEPARLLKALSESLPQEEGRKVWAAVEAVNSARGIL